MATDREMKQAARLLRGYKRRVEKLEEQREPEGEVNILRLVRDTATADDTVSVGPDAVVSDTAVAEDSVSTTVRTATPGSWDSDDWGSMEWG